MQIGLVSCRQLPEPDPDAAPLEEALRARGHSVLSVAWDDPHTWPEKADLLAIRSTWNYHERPDDFLAWVEQAASRVPIINTPEVIRWNIHKGYLLQLAAAGVSVVPTHQVKRGERDGDEIRSLLSTSAGVVVKPAIGAGSAHVNRFAADCAADALACISEMSSRCDVLVQPYVDGFRDPGERSLIWIDGVWTHAIRKRPRFMGQDERVESSFEPTAEELETANRALAAAPPGCAYARVDLVRGPEGKAMLSELELIEPSLYFDHSAAALKRFVGAIERLC